MPKELLVSGSKEFDTRLIRASSDKGPQVYLDKGELAVSVINKEKVDRNVSNVEQANMVIFSGDYRPHYSRPEPFSGDHLSIELLPNWDRIPMFEENEMTSMKVAFADNCNCMMEVIVMDPNQLLLQKMADKDAVIYELNAKLNEFERKLSFVPNGLVLPDNYFDDLVE